MSARSDENSAKRRKVRKGTRSCWECRRRKVRCIFASAEDSICITCRQRSSKCVSQLENDEQGIQFNQSQHVEHGAAANNYQFTGDDGPDSQTYSRQAFASPPNSSSITSTPAVTLPSNSLREHSSASRQNGHIGRPLDQLTTPNLPLTPLSNHSSSITKLTTHSKVTDALLGALPCRKDIEILVERVDHACMYSLHSSFTTSVASKTEAQHTVSSPSLLHPESHPVMLAKQMLQLVAELRHIHPSERIPGLSKHHHDIMHELAELAIGMVTTNDALLGTLEGLENIIFEAHYHIDCGNIRRSWITMRRGVMVGQLLGLHRPGQYRFKLINEKSNLDPEAMWGFIFTTERVLSLLLGLPSSVGCPSSATSPPPRDVCRVLSAITARVLERNQINGSQQAYDMTREIDRELVIIMDKVPNEFWQPLAFAGLEKGTMEAVLETRRAWEQMCYYSLVNQLHLPYMLSPKHATQRVYSRIACANASREVLNREIALRTFNQGMVFSRINDFLALIAGMTLMLAHATSHCRGNQRDNHNNNNTNDNINPLAHQRSSDRATVERALDCIKSMSELQEDVLAVKCAGILRDLLAIEADAAKTMLRGTDADGKGEHNMLIVTVPYLGTIGISRKGVTPLAPNEVEQHRGPNEGVTIGGIGSMHFTSPQSPSDSKDDAVCALSAPGSPVTRELDAPFQGGHLPHEASGHATMQHEDTFPDAAAPLDDWVLQGFDTAFFDVLMREQMSHDPDESVFDTYS